MINLSNELSDDESEAVSIERTLHIYSVPSPRSLIKVIPDEEIE